MTRRVLTQLTFVLVCLAGCEKPRPVTEALPVAPDQGVKAAESAKKSYKIVGVVRKVDQKAGEAVIKHESIPGYMPAMTMPFRVPDKESLAELRPGDEVEGTLQIEGEHSELTGLVVTRPAPAEPLRLDLSGGALRFKTAQRVLEPGEMVPDFTMTTQDGKTLRLADLRGKVVVLTFIYTRCPLPDFCPLMDKKMAELASKLAAVPARAEQVRLLSLSFDPEHDTPEVLAKHARMQGAQPPLWTFAVAGHDELAKVAPALGLTYGPTENEIVHNLSTSIIDREGRLVRLETGAAGKAWSPTDFFKAVNGLLPKRARER